MVSGIRSIIKIALIFGKEVFLSFYGSEGISVSLAHMGISNLTAHSRGRAQASTCPRPAQILIVMPFPDSGIYATLRRAGLNHPFDLSFWVLEIAIYCLDNFFNIHIKGPRLSAWICGYPKNS